ncbi:unnamed protein product [Dovyalis caffra]|uniref:Uncharacterized protein n=1 Tax=Dovyalis caffra TaxID=77055 RepID=A0AAV1STN1_9ROSI|nr:unnamed protein product [Dovyalis caffra]
MIEGKDGDNPQNFEWKSLASIIVEEGNIRIEKKDHVKTIILSTPFKERSKKLWELSVVIKVLGKSVGYRALCIRLETIRNAAKPLRIIDKEIDFSLVRFSTQSNNLHALVGILWLFLVTA